MKKKKKSKLKGISSFLVNNKKKILSIFIFIIFVLLVLVVFKYFYSNNSVNIEIASTNVNYIYGPNGSTTLKVGVNETVDLKILTVKGKENRVKCYATNDSYVTFIDNNSFKTLKKGTTEIYCKLVNKESNKINIIIGD